MGKRLATVFLIVLGVALAGVTIFTLTLFMAPGLSLFGVKYIAKGTHVVNESYVLTEKMEGGTFSGSVRIESGQVPISIVFSQKFAYQVEYYDNYNGLTNSKFDDPSIEFLKDSDGTAVIKVTSFNKFIYENGNSSRWLKLYIPSPVVGGTREGETSLKIVSKSANVNFCEEKDDHYSPYFRNIDIETNGKITSSVKVKTDNYSLKTINAIKITEDEFANINATNYILNSTGGKIVVDREVAGDINATTKNSRIQILSCRNFTANAGYGDVYSARKNVGVKINGTANITTTAGIVEIESILGSAKSTINTKTGNVKITDCQDLDLTTTRGFIRVNSAKNINVTTSSGSITVETATESVTAKTKRGKVFLGGEENRLYNPKVETTFGDVSVISASGTVKIDTVKADVDFVNKDASNIKLSVGGDLSATKLLGAVEVSVDGNADIEFADFTQKTTITGLSEKSTITVRLLNNDENSFSFDLEGKDASLFEYNAEDPSNSHQIGKSTNLTSSADKVGKPLLAVTTVGKLVVYFKLT